MRSIVILLSLFCMAEGTPSWAADEKDRAAASPKRSAAQTGRATEAVGISYTYAKPLMTKLLHGHPDKMRSILNEIPKTKHTANSRALWEATCLTMEDEPEQAAKEFDRVTNLMEASDPILLRAGTAYTSTEQYAKAIPLLNRVIEHTPRSRDALRQRAICFSAVKDMKAAVADYEKLAEVDPGGAKKYLIKASVILRADGQYKEGLAVLNKILDGNSRPDNGLYISRGLCLEHLNRWSEAASDFTKGIEESLSSQQRGEIGANPALCTSYLERAKCYDKLGKTELAKADRKALERFSRGMEEEFLGAEKTPTKHK